MVLGGFVTLGVGVISLGGMVSDFGVPPTVASTTIVMYGLAVAALILILSLLR